MESRAYRSDWREGAGALVLSAEHRERGIDVVLAPDEKRRSLVQLGWLNVKNALGSVSCRAASLLDDEGKRTRFVQQPQLPALVLSVGGVGEQASTEQIPMEIGDERADVASVHRLTVSILSSVVVHEILHSRLPLTVVGIIHRKVSADVRSANVRMRKQKLAE